MYSQEQMDVDGSLPQALMFGVRGFYWWNDTHGVEGAVKTKLANVNSGAKGTSPTSVEVRYHYRFEFPYFNPFSSVQRNTKVTLVAGVETYRNSGSGIYSQQYDLIKGGFSIAFPFANRWTTGGEVLLGYGLDSTTKTEISGNMNYYLSHDLALGVGYRVHLLTPGSSKSRPSGVTRANYREGYGEGYSLLRWHY